MRGGNFLALLLIFLAVVLFWLALSGNYKAVMQALGTPKTPAASGGGGSAGGF